MNLRYLAIAGACIVFAGCSSAPSVTDVSTAGATQFAGVPFRIRTSQTFSIWKLDDDGSYKLVSVSTQMLPDFTRLYALDVEAAPFASPSLHIAENPDNTLKVMQVTSATGSSAAIDAVTSSLNGVVKAQNDKASAKLTNSSAIATAEKAVRDAQLALDQLPAGTTDQTRVAYQAYLDSARRQANDAYGAAGLPRPYP